ncbi:methyltransferase domain-containing protein [Allosaccharopolyspora coralli]|uniref:Methyltransferase domain-containing protein n=2 Tax=Allosaccharopolyspora coralli TaxID=2665642 RepID=A0A5Q3QFQ3_9PSEU|nr:methyltransferase domain-containing protein [Allosaccharopolyspora coralli]
MDWNARLDDLRHADRLVEPERATLAEALVGADTRSVVEIGCGAGGMATALAAAMDHRSQSTLTLVDSAPELLGAAESHVRDSGSSVDVRTVLWDAAGDEVPSALEPADLVFAGMVVHHLPDQAAGLRRLAALVRPGGALAIVESGLPQRILPWDVGVGEPGLEDRLSGYQQSWFREMRAGIHGSVRMPIGWSRALREAGLVDVRSWSYLVERPAPVSDLVMRAALRRLRFLRDSAAEHGTADDLAAVDALLDEDGPHYVGHRDDLHYLLADTVHTGLAGRAG